MSADVPADPSPSDGWRWAEWLLLGQVVVVAGLNGVRGLGRSLWLDETLTWWATSGSLEQMASRAVEHQGQTPFFFLTVWPMVQLFGESEVALRLPSLLLHVLSTFFLYRLGRAVMNREAGLLAALLFQALWAIQLGAPDARPYTLAICLLVLATLFLVRWEQGRRGAAWGYVAAMLGSINAHVLLAPALIVHALYLAAGDGLRGRGREWVGPAVAFALGCLPSLALVLLLRGKWELYSFAPMPVLGDLAWSWRAVPNALAVCAGVFLIGGAGRMLPWRGPGLRRRDHVLLWSWALLPALILYSLSHLRDLSVFVPRYHAWQIPGMALLVTGLVMGFTHRPARAAIAAMYFVTTVVIVVTRPSNEEWRQAIAYINGQVDGEDTPVLVWSGLVESRSLEWFQAPENRPYMLAPTSFYPLGGRIVPVPAPGTVERLEDFLPPAQAADVRTAPSVWVLASTPDAARRIVEWARPGDVSDAIFSPFRVVTVARIGPE